MLIQSFFYFILLKTFKLNYIFSPQNIAIHWFWSASFNCVILFPSIAIVTCVIQFLMLGASCGWFDIESNYINTNDIVEIGNQNLTEIKNAIKPYI